LGNGNLILGLVGVVVLPFELVSSISPGKQVDLPPLECQLILANGNPVSGLIGRKAESALCIGEGGRCGCRGGLALDRNSTDGNPFLGLAVNEDDSRDWNGFDPRRPF